MTFEQRVTLTGTSRFDIEIESWLSEMGFQIRWNALTSNAEVHRNGAKEVLSDIQVAKFRFSFAFASNGKEPSKEKIFDALCLIADRNTYHPVRDYLDGLTWDGVRRLDTWLTTFAGVGDTGFVRAVARKTLCAAVRRARDPGCKFDHVLVLSGCQDLGKSRLLRALPPTEDWFTDQVRVGADSKEVIERSAGSLIVELAELVGMGARESEAVKHFITTQSDTARPAYGRLPVTLKRQFILIGTTNARNFLRDLTGNRRWWIVEATKCDPDGLAEVRDQLWAEAVQREPDERLYLDTDALRVEGQRLNQGATDYGAWAERVHDQLPAGPLKVAVSDAWTIVGIDGGTMHRMKLNDRMLLRQAMAGAGFEPETRNLRNSDRKQVKTYVRGNIEEAVWWAPSAVLPPATRDCDW